MTVTLQLRTRLGIAGTLLIGTTLATGVWSVTSFRNVSRVVDETVTDDERATDATAKLAGGLEREDDAMLLALSDSPRGKAELVRERASVERALVHLANSLHAPDERRIATQLRSDIDIYRHAGDRLVESASSADARMRYHEQVNPLLRRAVATTNQLRDQHFRSSLLVAEWARDRSTQSMLIVGAISVAALILLIAIVLHLARVVMLPLRETTRAVEGIRRGDFTQRVRVRRDDELGRLGGGLNRMADELQEFRRANIGEVIKAKETLEATLEALPDAVIVIDRDRNVSSTNPRAVDALGSVHGRGLDDLPVPLVTRDSVDAVLRSSAAPDPRVDLARAIELEIAGRPRKLLPRVVPIEGSRGAVLVLSDVTELVRLDEMRLELVAVASHELRTPLTTMRMTLLMMKERAAAYEPRDREIVETAVLGVEQLSTLVDEFLDLTQIEAGQLRLEWSRVSLAELVEHCARGVEASQIHVEVHTEGAVESIAGDRKRLGMAVSNVLSNAIKYTPAGGRIEVRATLGARATIEVIDSGPGVPAEFRERIFDRFFRVEHVRGGEVRPAGVGIGLYIARQVIAAHGGTIQCDAAPNGGARFAISIPLER